MLQEWLVLFRFGAIFKFTQIYLRLRRFAFALFTQLSGWRRSVSKAHKDPAREEGTWARTPAGSRSLRAQQQIVYMFQFWALCRRIDWNWRQIQKGQVLLITSLDFSRFKSFNVIDCLKHVPGWSMMVHHIKSLKVWFSQYKNGNFLGIDPSNLDTFVIISSL